ncbi:hypothetical protein [Salarchaeum japonicum]|uniref:hypothetical protein n=1 Tax=Salarchaeum japonicum TaxID=555573 RepID=UPI001D0AABA8|nr:hypothetical protein [Salarchaeum japonicum]
MKASQRFIVVACAIFAVLAGATALVLPPDSTSTLPVNLAAMLVCWPIAYWVVYHRRGKRRF